MNSVYQFIRELHILARVEDAIDRRAFTLNLSRFELTEVHPLTTQCSWLLKLFLNNNNIPTIPDSFVAFNRLLVLTLDYNSLQQFPEVLCKLTTLKFINISCNSIESLPQHFGHLTKLETLWCNHTGLKSFPEEIGNCDFLETLGARSNEIIQLPESFGLLSKLRWLTLENNNIAELPAAFVALDCLVHLNLKSNKLKEFPKCLYQLKQLQFVFVNCNEISEFSAEDFESTSFMRMVDINDNPFRDEEGIIKAAKDFRQISFKSQESSSDDFENIFDDDSENSDWENSVATSDINSTDNSDDEHNVEDISELLPHLSKYFAIAN